MVLSDEKINGLSVGCLNDWYANIVNIKEIDTFNAPDIVIDTLISLVEKLESFNSFSEKKYIIRQFVAEKLFDELEKYAPDNQSANYINFSQKIDAFLFCYKLFLNIEESDFENIALYDRIVSCKNMAKARQDFSYLPEIIVSLTSFPGRIDKVYMVLNSIFTQSFKADRVILWLAEEQFPEKRLPESLTDYIQLGLEIRWCKEDLRSHKKYYYVMQEYPKAIIITVDDDLIYDAQMIEVLVTSYLHFPYAVSAIRTHLMKMDNDHKIAPYMQWGNEFSGVLGKPSMQLFATSGAGTLYPPDCMDIELFNMENIQLLAPNADDLWFKIMQVKKDTPVVLAKRNEKLVYVPNSQEIGLRHDNRNNNGNDRQLEKLLSVYDQKGDLRKKIFEDNYSADSYVIGVDIFQNNDYGTLDGVQNFIKIAEKNKKDSEILYKKYTDLENKSKKLSEEIENIKNSVSFKIGRFVTFVPRKIRRGNR